MSFTAALDELEQGVPPNVTVVSLPEGLSRKEMAPIVRQADLRGNYLRATRRNPRLNPRNYGAEGPRNLEGFLFPATYQLRKGGRRGRSWTSRSRPSSGTSRRST